MKYQMKYITISLFSLVITYMSITDCLCQEINSDSVETFVSKQLGVSNCTGPIKLVNGQIFIAQKKSDNQIYIKRDKILRKITKYKPFERIDYIQLSLDGSLLLVYHRENNGKAYQISVYDMKSLSKINSIFPGYGGTLLWTVNNNIFHIWGCGSDCGNFRIYDKELNIIKEISGNCFSDFIKQNIIVSIPCTGADKGIFNIYSLDSGNIIKTVDYSDKYGEYYCDGLEILNGKIKVRLQKDISVDSFITEFISY